jgi:hypothetical protein
MLSADKRVGTGRDLSGKRGLCKNLYMLDINHKRKQADYNPESVRGIVPSDVIAIIPFGHDRWFTSNGA